MSRRRTTFTLGVGGLLAAGLLPAAVAFADDGLIFEPADGSYYLESGQPLPPLLIDGGPISVAAGDEYWNAVVGYNSPDAVAYPGALVGYEVHTTFGLSTNDFFTVQGGLPIVPIPDGTMIDIADFGGGYGNDWIDVPGTGLGSGMSDLLITPFGDLPLFGTALG